MQDNIWIGDVQVPTVVDDGVRYYPISYLSSKVLLRNGNIIGSNSNQKLYAEYIKRFIVDFSFINGGTQESKFISEEGLKKVIGNMKIGRLSVDQRKAMNELLEHLGIDSISEEEQFKNKLSENDLNSYNIFIRDAIDETIKENRNIKFQKCSKCNHYYPFHENFFRINLRSPNGLNTFCRDCGWTDTRTKDKIQMNDKELQRVYYTYGKEMYLMYKNHNTIEMYEHFLNDTKYSIPDVLRNKDDYLKIIKYLYENGIINKNDLTIGTLSNENKLIGLTTYTTLHEIYTMLFGEDYFYYPYKYTKFTYKDIKLTYEIAEKVFNNYVREYNIDFSDPLLVDYQSILYKSCIRKLDIDVLSFAVKYNNNKYAGYKFKTRPQNYYKIEDNLLFDLKYFIEEDIKIDIDKIPLYITKNVLQKKCRSLYNYIILNKNGSIYEWVNKLYPDKFTENDFEINAYRNEFDSDTESFIHEILTEMFGSNVIYNQKHTDRTITLDGMIPDWFIITENGTWIVEYFGLYVERQYGKSSRVTDYIDKTYRKIEKYNKMKNFKYVFLYPEDIEDSFKGCREKLSEIG